MSEVGSAGTPAVHANTANDASRAAAMPEVPQGVERMRPSDLARGRREGTLGAKPAPTPQQAPAERHGLNDVSARKHLAERSRELEAKSEPVQAETAELPSLGEGAPETAEADAQTGEPDAEVLAAAGLSDAEILQKYRDWETGDLFPDELLGKMHEVKVNGQLRYVDTNELRQGYIRHSDYTKRGQEIKQRETAVEQYRNSMKEHFEAARNPDNFLEMYERNGYSDVLEQVAEKIAVRRSEHRGLVVASGRAMAERLGYSPEQIRAGEADRDHRVISAMESADSRLKSTRQLEIENRKLSHERDQITAQQKQAQHAQETAKHQEVYKRQLDQLRPGAFSAHGLKDTQQNRTAFLRHLSEVIQVNGLGQDGITRQHVMSAATNLRDEQQDQRMAESHSDEQFLSPQEFRARQQAEQRRALPPNRTSTGAGKPLAAQQNKAMSASDFVKMRREGKLGK